MIEKLELARLELWTQFLPQDIDQRKVMCSKALLRETLKEGE